MDRHLVTIEVRVERRADEGMDPDRLALHQHRLERLNPEAVQGRGAVQQDGMFVDDLLEHIPDFGLLLFHHLFGLLDGRDQAAGFELVVDERLEQLERHLLRQPALVELQLRPHDDHRAPGVVDTLAEQVLAKPPLLPFERVRQGLERSVVGPSQDATPPPVVEERIDRFLQHSLLVANDHVRGLQLDELLEPVVPVDDTPVQIIEVGRREASAIQRHERPQLGGNDRGDVEDHPLRTVGRLAEGVDHFEPLGVFQLFLNRHVGPHLLAQLHGQFLDIHPLEQLFDRFGAHLGPELVAVVLAPLPVLLFGQQLVQFEVGVSRIDDDVGLKIEDALEVAERNIQQVTDPARESLEEPDVAHRGGQVDVPHALTSHLRLRDLDPTLVANHPPVLHPLVLPAQAFPVGDRTEDLGAEQPVPLGFERAVVDGLGLGHLAVGPGKDLLRRGETDPNGVKIGRQRAPIRKAGSHTSVLNP